MQISDMPAPSREAALIMVHVRMRPPSITIRFSSRSLYLKTRPTAALSRRAARSNGLFNYAIVIFPWLLQPHKANWVSDAAARARAPVHAGGRAQGQDASVEAKRLNFQSPCASSWLKTRHAMVMRSRIPTEPAPRRRCRAAFQTCDERRAQHLTKPPN